MSARVLVSFDIEIPYVVKLTNSITLSGSGYELKFISFYLDDILILSNEDDTFDDHLAKLNEVFK